MSIFSKKNGKSEQKCIYRGIKPAAKLAAPVLSLLYYVLVVGVLLAAIIAFIMIFVNTAAEDMMLPPFMSVHGEEYYSIRIGSGIRVEAAYESVTTGDIKTVVYAQLMIIAACMCILAPISLFLSKIAKNIAKDGEYDLINARYMIYMGLTVMVGSTFVRLARGFYNYLLVKTFVSDPDTIRFAFELDLGGIAVGLLIIVLAYIYGNACEKYILERAASHELEKI